MWLFLFFLSMMKMFAFSLNTLVLIVVLLAGEWREKQHSRQPPQIPAVQTHFWPVEHLPRLCLQRTAT